MEIKELRNKPVDELKQLLLEHKRELFNLRFQRATGEMQNPARFSQVRKIVARVLTVINEKNETAA